jgi:dTDP-4-amino-4,6-dideoxygalactose transaminase
MTCTATNGVLANRGAKIVWADVDPVTGLIDPSDVWQKVTKRTKAIMAVDWAGRSCDYHSLQLTGLPVIQDAAHNLFVDMSDDGVNRGDYVAWSFQAIKHLTTGDGGALLAPPEQMERARLLRWYGLDRRSSADFRCAQDIVEPGFKYHMNDIAASIGLANIPHAEWIVEQHRANAAYYARAFHDAPGIMVPPTDPRASWWLYTLLVEDRASLASYLSSVGIASSPVHRRNDEHPAFSSWRTYLPGVDAFAARELAIPTGWWVTPEERGYIADSVMKWAHSRVPAMAA